MEAYKLTHDMGFDSIIALFHEHRSTPAAIDAVIDLFRSLDFKFVSLEDCHDNFVKDNSGTN